MCFTFSATKPFIIPLKKLDIIYSFARNYSTEKKLSPKGEGWVRGNKKIILSYL
jgi:hypothetical protein